MQIKAGDKVEAKITGTVSFVELGTPDNPIALVVFELIPPRGIWKGMLYIPVSQLTKVLEGG